jgi:hypothetical protein
MDKEVLIDGYKKVINEIYGGNEYYNRVLDFIQRFTPNRNNKLKLNTNHLIAFSRSFFRLGIVDTYRKHYWNLFFWTLFNRPKLVPLAITYSVYGFHFRKIFKDVL